MVAFRALVLAGVLLAAEATSSVDRAGGCAEEAGGGEECKAHGQDVEEPDQEVAEDAEAEQLSLKLLQTGLAHLRKHAAPKREVEEEQEVLPFLKLPPCKQNYWLSRLAEQSASWCDPRQVSPEERAPPKLQGLFWLNGLPLPDVAACFSRGVWDKEKRTLRINVWSDFVFRDNLAADFFESEIFKADMHYLLSFQDENLTNGTLHPQGSGLYSSGMKVFDVVSDFPMIEDQGLQVPGEKWHRPSYFGLGSLTVKVNEYFLWRILDGNLKVVQPNVQAMVRALDRHRKGYQISRYSADCLSSEACDRNTGGTCNAFRCHRWRGKVECVNHGLVWRCLCAQGYCAVNGRCVLVRPSKVGQATSILQAP